MNRLVNSYSCFGFWSIVFEQPAFRTQAGSVETVVKDTKNTVYAS
jgi:hypothetical protein